MNKITKIILMTKNDKDLIKPWIKYHGEIFGYQNLYIIDDSDDPRILNYYKSIDHLPIHIYQDNENLNTITAKINKIMFSIKNECDFLIKLDTDEFIAVLDQETNAISISTDMICHEFDNLIVDGNKYKCSYEIRSMPLKEENNILNHIYFTKPRYTDFKTFFNSKTYLHCDLGSHRGTLIEPYEKNKPHDTNIAIIHYHYRNFSDFIQNCKQTLVSHNYINDNDSKEIQISKLASRSGCQSIHRIKYYLRYLTEQDYQIKYYDELKSLAAYRFEEFKNLFAKDNIL